MLFGGSGRATEAVQAQLILAVLLLAILSVVIVAAPRPLHAIMLDLWPLPDWSTLPSGDTVAMVRVSRGHGDAVTDVVGPMPLPEGPIPRIELTPADTILFEGRPVDLVGLRMELDWLDARDEFWLELRPDAEARYERFDEVLAVIGRAGEFQLRIDNRPFRNALD